MPEISLVLSVNQGTVWRVGFRPEPWAWSDWKHATDEGRFNGRWDDINGQFRTVYADQSLFACLIEVLAKYRRDTHLADTLKDIVEDPADAILAELFNVARSTVYRTVQRQLDTAR